MPDGEDERDVHNDKKQDYVLDEPILYSTTDGRQNFPNILQTVYGDKIIIGFGRYGRALAAAVPIEAIRMLAGFGEKVDDDQQRRIRHHARALLALLPRERAICGLDRIAPPKLVELQDVDARRAAARAGRGQKRAKPKVRV